jgi:hypothetical protein
MPKYPGETYEGREPLTNKNAADLIVFEAEQILFNKHAKSVLEHKSRRFVAAAGPVAVEGTVILGLAMGGMFFPLSNIRKPNDTEIK